MKIYYNLEKKKSEKEVSCFEFGDSENRQRDALGVSNIGFIRGVQATQVNC